jgi:hypothetical protein
MRSAGTSLKWQRERRLNAKLAMWLGKVFREKRGTEDQLNLIRH